MRHMFVFVWIGALLCLGGCSPDKTQATATGSCGLASNLMGTFVTVPSGAFVVGSQPVYPEEGPAMRLQVAGFEIQRHEVTNDQFAAFVKATGYVTEAENPSNDARLDVGSGVFRRSTGSEAQGGAWGLVKGATWRTPDGAGSTLSGKGSYPVIHVTYRDAKAYADWSKTRLPTQVEWEYAASLGLPDPEDRRSGAYQKDGKPRANTWQGVFPLLDEGADGFQGPAPAGCYPSDRLGLVDMIGNVWEWTSDKDEGTGMGIIKGGSHLCADNFCGRYRPEARQFQELNLPTNHIGFRVVRDLVVPNQVPAP